MTWTYRARQDGLDDYVGEMQLHLHLHFRFRFLWKQIQMQTPGRRLMGSQILGFLLPVTQDEDWAATSSESGDLVSMISRLEANRYIRYDALGTGRKQVRPHHLEVVNL